MTREPLVALSALEHHVFCPRQCALIHVDGLWSENRATVAGRRAHERVDERGGRRARARVVLHAIPLYSDIHGLIGRGDTIEVHDNNRLIPVEHKAGVRHGASADVQLCAQALCLEEMFNVAVPTGFVWYGGTRRRRAVSIDSSLRRLTLEVVAEVRASMTSGKLPPPPNDARCPTCQLNAVCLPDVVSRPEALAQYIEVEVLSCD